MYTSHNTDVKQDQIGGREGRIGSKWKTQSLGRSDRRGHKILRKHEIGWIKNIRRALLGQAKGLSSPDLLSQQPTRCLGESQKQDLSTTAILPFSETDIQMNTDSDSGHRT